MSCSPPFYPPPQLAVHAQMEQLPVFRGGDRRDGGMEEANVDAPSVGEGGQGEGQGEEEADGKRGRPVLFAMLSTRYWV